jgi:hypothetical protein
VKDSYGKSESCANISLLESLNASLPHAEADVAERRKRPYNALKQKKDRNVSNMMVCGQVRQILFVSVGSRKKTTCGVSGIEQYLSS